MHILLRVQLCICLKKISYHFLSTYKSTIHRFKCSMLDATVENSFETKYYAVWSITRYADIHQRADMPHLSLQPARYSIAKTFVWLSR